MGCTIDHLSADHVVRVLEGFTDARGVTHHPGEEGILRRMDVDLVADEIHLEWERAGRRETMAFLLSGRTGPGNGRMKRFFELREPVVAQRPGFRFVPLYGYVPANPPELPPVTDELIRDSARFDEAMQRVWALAGRRRFAEAETQLRTIVAAPDRAGDNAYRAAGELCARALAHGFDADRSVHTWLREQGIGLWYSWGAGATSGGDGACRALEIRSAEEQFTKLDRARQRVR